MFEGLAAIMEATDMVQAAKGLVLLSQTSAKPQRPSAGILGSSF